MAAANDWKDRRDAAAARTLERELLLLRKSAGFTPLRLSKAPILLHMLGGAHQTFEVHRERFVSAITSLREPEPELLLAIFALTEVTSGLPVLSERRARYGRSIRRGPDTVADREPAALEHLRSQLITGWYPKSPLSVRVPESHNGVVQESVSVRTLIRDTCWVETREHYRIFAAFDEAEYLTISSSQPRTPIPEGDEFTVRTEHIGDSYSHQFWHKTPMRRGNFYDLRFRRQADTDYARPRDLVEESRAFHEPTRYATFELVLQGEVPDVVWRYGGLTYFERPGRPSAGAILKPVGGRVRCDFRDLYGGLFFGIAWRWGTATILDD